VDRCVSLLGVLELKGTVVSIPPAAHEIETIMQAQVGLDGDNAK